MDCAFHSTTEKFLFQFLVKMNLMSVAKGTLSRSQKERGQPHEEISKFAQNVLLGISVPFDFPLRMVNDLHFGKSTTFWIFSGHTTGYFMYHFPLF